MVLSQGHIDYVVAFTRQLHERVLIKATGLEDFFNSLMDSGCGSYHFNMGAGMIGKIHVSPEMQTVTFGHELIGEDALIPDIAWYTLVGQDERAIYLYNCEVPGHPIMIGFANVPIFREGLPSLSVDAFMAHYLSKVEAGLEARTELQKL